MDFICRLLWKYQRSEIPIDPPKFIPDGGYTHQTLAEQSSLIYAIDFQELRDQIRGAWGSGAGGVEMRWLVADQLGTPRMVIDHTGSLSGVRRHDYFPFGEEIPADATWRTIVRGYGRGDSVRQKFAAYERDNETGLDYAQARYHANIQGRFTSVDPSRKSIVLTNPQSWNRYSYTLNNPLAYVDKNGKWPTSIHERIIDLALPGLSNDQRQMIKRASYDVDHKSGAQSTENSYKHGMRAPNESVDDAVKESAQWISDWKKAAQRTSDQNTALYAFGVAFHTVSDMTSPEHEGFQVWHGIVDRTLVARSGLHALGESLGFNFYRQGLAVGATERLYADTFGNDALKQATGGIEFGSESDPTVQDIHRRADMTGATPAEEGEALFEYRLGLTRGLNFNYEDPRQRRRQGEHF